MKLTFWGAAKTVTGSRHLIEADGKRFLVDAGLFQGPKAKRLLNWTTPFKSSTLDGVILTHAHIDHSGLIPRLVKEGFNKPIYCSQATAELCRFMLLDSAKLQEEDASYANRSGYSHHKPADPLYTIEDAEKAIKLFEIIDDHEWFHLSKRLQVRFFRSGHILGSRFVQIAFPTANGSATVLFSGDLGNSRSPLLKHPESPVDSDYIVVESTYGDRLLPHESPMDPLADIINKVISRGGILMIPAFAVGRTQDIIHYIGRLKQEGKISKEIPVFIDSPMATDATQTYLRHINDLKNYFSEDEIHSPLNKETFKCTNSVDESKALMNVTKPYILISASGMLSGGRIMHHLKQRISNPLNALLFVGYQAEGTKGRVIIDGADTLRVHHMEYPIKAEILKLPHFSAHADYSDIQDWLKGLQHPPKKIFLNHGEFKAQEHLKGLLQIQFPTSEIIIPDHGEEFHLT